jgi:hypothetical protein
MDNIQTPVFSFQATVLGIKQVDFTNDRNQRFTSTKFEILTQHQDGTTGVGYTAQIYQGDYELYRQLPPAIINGQANFPLALTLKVQRQGKKDKVIGVQAPSTSSTTTTTAAATK